MPCLIYIADRLAAELGQGFRMDLPSTAIDPAVMEAVRLSPESLAEFKNGLPEALKSVESMLT